jgi:ammonium transporter, Amt family
VGLRLRRLAVATVGLTVTSMLLAGPAFASSTAAEGKPEAALASSVNLLWIIIGAALVIFMQAGFALVETGMCRAKHAAHVVSTNFAIFGLGFVGFFLIGFPLMFGGYSFPGLFGIEKPMGSSFIGSGDWTFLYKGPIGLTGKGYDVAIVAFFLYMVAFMDTTATIPTGSMAERWKWKSFCGWGLFCGALYYPIFGAWTWGGGWLSQLGDSMSLGHGYADFAGSGVVHAVGGVAALAGAIVLGPRIGKFGPDGKPRTLSAHHLPMAMLGTFILLFGWFGFNAASTFAATDNRFTVAAVNTAIAAAFGATFSMFYLMATGAKKPDPGMMINGMLAGLVAITAPCAFVTPLAAAIIGVTAAFLVIKSCAFFESKGIDDPVGAISVHGVGGLYGVLCVGIFADGSYGKGWNALDRQWTKDNGVTGLWSGDFANGFKQLISQAIGVLVLCTVIFGLAYGFFYLQNKFTKGGIRSNHEDELMGVDMPEMGVLAYPEFPLISDGLSEEVNTREKVNA